MSDRNKLTADSLKTFALGGRATLTVESPTGNHVTYKLERPKKDQDNPHAPIFVKVFTGTDNDDWRHYTYMGCVWVTDRKTKAPSAPKYTHGRKSRVSADDPKAKGAAWLIDVIAGRVKPSPGTTFWHEGRCCFCARKLTAPGSCDVGYGPDCAEARGLPYPGKKERKQKRETEVKIDRDYDAEIARRDREDSRRAAEAKAAREDSLIVGANGLLFEVA